MATSVQVVQIPDVGGGLPLEALEGGLQFMKVSLALVIHFVNSYRALLQHHVTVEAEVLEGGQQYM